MYKKLVSYRYVENHTHYLKDNDEFYCRFCKMKKNKSYFKNEAHAVSECVGNKTLRTKYECDECNDHFSQNEENELSKLIKFYKVNRGLRGKRGKVKSKYLSASFNERDKALELYFQDVDILYNKQLDQNQKVSFVLINNVVINTRLVYCALLKFILSIVPENKLVDFVKAFDILKRPEKNKLFLLDVILYKDIDRNYTISLYENITLDNNLPKYIGVIDIYQFSYIIFLDYENKCNFVPPQIIADVLNINKKQFAIEPFYIDYSHTQKQICQIEEISGVIGDINIS